MLCEDEVKKRVQTEPFFHHLGHIVDIAGMSAFYGRLMWLSGQLLKEDVALISEAD